jgi:hypothetical protein
MTLFETGADGERISTRYAPDYFRMIRDFASDGRLRGSYGDHRTCKVDGAGGTSSPATPKAPEPECRRHLGIARARDPSALGTSAVAIALTACRSRLGVV